MGLVAIHSLGIETGRLDCYASSGLQKHDFDEVKPFMVRLFEKASDHGVRLLLPCDFHCATKPAINIKSPVNKPSSNMGGGNTGDSGAAKDEEKKVTSAMEDTHGTHNSGAPNSVDDFVASNPEQHWSDVVYSMNKVHTVDLEEKV